MFWDMSFPELVEGNTLSLFLNHSLSEHDAHDEMMAMIKKNLSHFSISSAYYSDNYPFRFNKCPFAGKVS